MTRVLEKMIERYPSYGKFIGLEPGRVDRVRMEEVARERVAIRAWLEGPERSRELV